MCYLQTLTKYEPLVKPRRAVEHMFATVGNGVDLDNKGFITTLNASSQFVLGEPQPYTWIYPWSNNEEFQPFRKLAGCRDSGFKEAAQFFIDCITTSTKPRWMKSFSNSTLVFAFGLMPGPDPKTPRPQDPKTPRTTTMPDIRTLKHYEEYAPEIFGRYESIQSPLDNYFRVAFLSKWRVLDVGCASGRDIKALLRQGYDAYGVEPVGAFRALSSEDDSLANRVFPGALPSVALPESIGDFDGILCSAVLQHIDPEEHLDAITNLHGLLKSRGRLLISVPKDRGGLDDERRDHQGRLFAEVPVDVLCRLCSSLGMRLIDSFSDGDSLGRFGVTWNTLLFEKA